MVMISGVKSGWREIESEGVDLRGLAEIRQGG